MKDFDRRLRALEDRAAAAGEPGGITVAEWVQWRNIDEQPERWLRSPAVQAHAIEMQARTDAVEQMLREFADETD